MSQKTYTYGIRLAIVYSAVWFVELLDVSSLNVSLPTIASYFDVAPTDSEWVLMGFLLAMTIGIKISGWLGDNYGIKPIFIFSQLLYILSSFSCGFSWSISSLILFRSAQGFAGGVAIPLGMVALMRAMPHKRWAKTSASMNMVTLLAPAIGPIFGAYVAHVFGWQWIFFLKLPLSFLALAFTLMWVKNDAKEKVSRFDWPGFVVGSVCLIGVLWVFSEVGRNIETIYLVVAGAIALLLGYLFFRIEKKSKSPLIPFSIFRNRHFSCGNIIQSSSNAIFLGANFIIALYLQKGLGFNLVTSGWILAAITPGMLIVQPLIGRFFNKLGPLPFIIPGLTCLSLTTFAFAFTTSQTSPFILAGLVFCIGAASSITQAANFTSTFSGLSKKYAAAGCSLYALFKQLSASFGVAVSTMIASIGLAKSGGTYSPQIFHACFFVLGSFPALSLLCTFFIDNAEVKRHVSDHVLTETELGTE